MVQLAGYAARRVDELSGGQRQRVALARAIVFEPRILLMDEPLSALDKQLREHMQIELRRLHEQLGMTTVYVTHDQREALTMSDRVAVINHGRIMQLDAPRRLYERPSNRFIAEFIGESAFLPVEMASGVVTYAGQLIKVAGDPVPQGDYLLMLRPERLKILDAAAAGESSAHRNLLRGTVQNVVYQGESYLLQARLADGSTVSLRGVSTDSALATMPKPGEPVQLGFAPEDAVLVPDGAT